MVRILIGIVLIAHGIGHSLGLIGAFKVATTNPSWNGDSWLLTGVVGTTATQAIGSVLWGVALVLFVALGFVAFGWLPDAWWAPIGILASAASLVGIVLFPVAFPTFSSIAAAVVDLVVLASIFWFHWTPAELAA
jgi:hypothetical protein